MISYFKMNTFFFLFFSRFDATKSLAKFTHFSDDFLLHQIETHGDEGHADDEVHGTKNER